MAVMRIIDYDYDDDDVGDDDGGGIDEEDVDQRGDLPQALGDTAAEVKSQTSRGRAESTEWNLLRPTD
jgi:hypothetical protein